MFVVPIWDIKNIWKVGLGFDGYFSRQIQRLVQNFVFTNSLI